MSVQRESWFEEADENDEPSLNKWASQLEEVIAEAQDLLTLGGAEYGSEQELSDLHYEARCAHDEVLALLEEYPNRISDLRTAVARIRAGRMFESGSSLPGSSEDWDEAEVEPEEWESDWVEQE